MAVLFDSPDSDDVDTEMRLVPTQLSNASDQMRAGKIVASNTGRVFLAGSDGALHELEYGVSTTLYGFGSTVRHCYSINHTRGLMGCAIAAAAPAPPCRGAAAPPCLTASASWQSCAAGLCAQPDGAGGGPPGGYCSGCLPQRAVHAVFQVGGGCLLAGRRRRCH